MEVWRKIEAFPMYSVSDRGRVRNDKTGRIKKNTRNYYGYAVVCLQSENGAATVAVHQLVADAFLPKRPSSLHEINHKDGDKMNPAASNLEWLTHQENARHAADVLGKFHRKGRPECRPVICMEQWRYYASIAAASRGTGVSKREILRCINNPKKLYKSKGFAFIEGIPV